MAESCVNTSRKTLQRYGWIIPALLAAAVLALHYRMPGITSDGVTYLQIARNILLGKGLGWQALWASPLHSILVAAVSKLFGVTDLLAADAVVGCTAFFGLVMAVYFLARELFDVRSALVASAFTALSPHLLYIAFSPEAEITFTFLVTLALFLFARTVTRASRWYAACTGVFFALAWMARSEGAIVMAAVFAAAVALQGRGFYRSKLFKNCLLSCAFFVLVAAPYLHFLHEHYGRLVVSPKSSYVQIWMKSATYHDNSKGETANDDLWGLTPDGTKLRWQEPHGLGDLVSYLVARPARNLGVYLHNLSYEIPGRIPNNSGMERYPQCYPVYLALAALLALFFRWEGFPREKRAIALAPFLVLLVLPVFTQGWWKYVVGYLPLLCVLAAKGFSEGAALLARRLPAATASRTAGILLYAGTLVVCLRFVLALHPLPFGGEAAAQAPSREISERQALAQESEHVGRLGVQAFGKGKNYMSVWSKVVYYLEGTWTALPIAEDAAVVEYARRNKVDYLVMEGSSNVLDKPWNPEGLVLRARYRSAQLPYGADFYQVIPQPIPANTQQP